MQRKHIELIVHGRVQGVWYRKNARDTATALGLAGYAMNRSDGTVKIEAEGTPEALERFMAWCRLGPPGAEVTRVEQREGEPKGYARFEISR